MKFLKGIVIIFVLPLLVISAAHKFYVSTTHIEYKQEEQSIQIITKIFLDDIEDVLDERYNTKTGLATTKETERDRDLLKQYILQKFKISVNGKQYTPDYLGIDYETDMVKSYLEITNIEEVKALEIENKILMELFDEQQNIIHFNNGRDRSTIILEKENPKGLLKF